MLVLRPRLAPQDGRAGGTDIEQLGGHDGRNLDTRGSLGTVWRRICARARVCPTGAWAAAAAFDLAAAAARLHPRQLDSGAPCRTSADCCNGPCNPDDRRITSWHMRLWRTQQRAASLFNTMIVPLTRSVIEGAVFYQGESDCKPGLAQRYIAPFQR